MMTSIEGTPQKQDIKLELIEISKLKDLCDGLNPRIQTQDGRVALQISIKGFGFVEPIIGWRNEKGEPEIIVGHQRRDAAKKEGLKKVPIIFFPFKNREEAIAYNIMSNRAAELSDWDFPKLKDHIEFLDTGAIDLSLIGFDKEKIEDIMTWVRDPEAPNPDLDEELEGLAGMEDNTIAIIIPIKYIEKVKEWLANGERQTATGRGKGVLRRCGLL